MMGASVADPGVERKASDGRIGDGTGDVRGREHRLGAVVVDEPAWEARSGDAADQEGRGEAGVGGLGLTGRGKEGGAPEASAAFRKRRYGPKRGGIPLETRPATESPAAARVVQIFPNACHA